MESLEKQPNFFGKLFAFSFQTFVTPTIVSIIYGILVVLAGLGAIGFIIRGFALQWWVGLLALIASPIVFILYMVFARIWLEVVVVLFRIAEDLNAIRKGKG